MPVAVSWAVLLCLAVVIVYVNRMATSKFNLHDFISNPSHESLEACRKDDLLSLAGHFNLSISRALLKSEIRKLVVKRLTEEGVLAATHVVDTTTASILLEPALSPEGEVSHGREVTPDWAEPAVSLFGVNDVITKLGTEVLETKQISI